MINFEIYNTATEEKIGKLSFSNKEKLDLFIKTDESIEYLTDDIIDDTVAIIKLNKNNRAVWHAIEK